jgi:hypothetical protein
VINETSKIFPEEEDGKWPSMDGTEVAISSTDVARI